MKKFLDHVVTGFLYIIATLIAVYMNHLIHVYLESQGF